MTTFQVELRGVHKWFGAFHALRGIDLAVRRGERIAICGPSGSGKSTLLRCINGLERHQQGRIVVCGLELTDDPRRREAVRREVGMVFQQWHLFPHLTVLENCTLALVRVHRMARRDAQERALRYLRRVRIPEQAGKHPSELSGGQQQRAAIARSLCLEPQIMLFDEPTSALDPETVEQVIDTLDSLAEDGMTMLCVTHEMGFARRLADREVFIEDGRMVERRPSAAEK